MRRFWGTAGPRRLFAAALGLTIIGAAGAPSALPARGDGPTTIAVTTFQNEAGAPAGVASDLSSAAYRAIASSPRFVAKGGGPLGTPSTLTSDPFVEELQAAAKAGAEDMLTGSVIQASGGTVYYRLALYRVKPTTFIGSQVFSSGYPPSDPSALAAAMANDLSTLSAPRQAVGTIWSTSGGLRSDTGSVEGFMVGDRFKVVRNGQDVADATISTIEDDDASLTISNGAAGYTPMIGDKLVGQRSLAPALAPAPPAHSSYTFLGFFVAAGAALAAIAHHGQPGLPNGGLVPPPTTNPFSVQAQPIIDNVPQATFSFIFTTPVSPTSITNIPGLISYAQVNTQLPGSQATTPPQSVAAFCGCQVTFAAAVGPGGAPETLMSLTATNLVPSEIVFFDFFPTITDTLGNTLSQPAFFQSQPLSIFRHPVSMSAKPSVGPVAPGPGGFKPVVVPATGKNPDSKNPRIPH